MMKHRATIAKRLFLPLSVSLNQKLTRIKPAFVSGPIPSISVCMIVRNEERCLARCLESVKDLASEIILVDTGSSDRTVEIAQAFGAKVIHHAWNDHFAEARNVGLTQAMGEYILVIDADEVMVAGTGQRLLQYLARPDLQGRPWVLNWRVCSEHHRDLSTRGLFPNGYGIEFRGRLHEGLVLPSQTLAAYHCPDLVLWHDSLGAQDLPKQRYYQQLLLQSLAEETELALNTVTGYHKARMLTQL